MSNAMEKSNAQRSYDLNTTFDQIFNHSLRRFFDGNLWDRENDRTAGTVPVNVRESEQQYEVDVIAPGCKKEDFRIQLKANELSISFASNQQKSQSDEKMGWVRNEFVQHSFAAALRWTIRLTLNKLMPVMKMVY